MNQNQGVLYRRLYRTSIVAILAFLCLLPAGGFAQGTAFTYQGRLNSGGTPANGSFDLTFALFDAASSGTQQGTALTNAATAVSNGLFTVTLDFGNQFPGAGRWLEIGVTTNGGGSFVTLSPRQLLTATPYAIHAANVASNAVSAASIQNATITSNKIADNQVVRHLNGLRDGVYLVSGGGITIAPNSFDNSITLSAPSVSGMWQLGGNSGFGQPLDTVLGPTNASRSLNFRVNASIPLRLEHTGTNGEVSSPNIFGGFYQNGLSSGFGKGLVIGGGGDVGKPNSVAWDFAVVGGGLGNFAGFKSFVGGGEENSAGNGLNAVVGGWGNVVEGGDNFIGGGRGNHLTATSLESGIVGGESNLVSGEYAFIGGGRRNINSGDYAVVVGGLDNLAEGSVTTVVGGSHNSASGTYTFVGGGSDNHATDSASILGGFGNEGSGLASTVVGGYVGRASGNYASVLGGYGNVASGEASVAAGYFAKAMAPRSLVFSALNNGLTSSVPNEVLFGADQFTFQPNGNFTFDSNAVFRIGGKAHVDGALRAQNFIGDASMLSGTISNALLAAKAQTAAYATNADVASRMVGNNNVQIGDFNFIGGGRYNTNTGNYAGIGSGSFNAATADEAFVGGGNHNQSTGFYSSILGGYYNTASAGGSAVLGGLANTASGPHATALGGEGNVASGAFSLAGGYYSTASGYASIALGEGAHAAHSDSLVWNSYGNPATSSIPREVLLKGDRFTFVPYPFGGPYGGYTFNNSQFRIGGNAQVAGDFFAIRFFGDGAGLSNIVSTTALTANYATSAGSAGTAYSATIAVSAAGFTDALAGEVTGNQGTTVVAKLLSKSLSGGAPAINTVLRYDGTNWQASKLSLTSDTTGSIASNQIAAAAINANQVNTTNSPIAGQVLQFTGSGLAWLDPNSLVGNFWQLAGNAGTTPGAQFLGTTDNQPLEFKVNNIRALRLEPNTTSPNVIAGSQGNVVSNGLYGSVIAGGGSASAPNRVGNNFATIIGGSGNLAAGDYSLASGFNCTANGSSSAAFGYRAKANHYGSFVWADAQNSDFSSSGIFQFLIRATGGVGINTNNPSGAALAVHGNITTTSNLTVAGSATVASLAVAGLTTSTTARINGNNNWGVSGGEGDFRVGNDTYRFKIGVANGGGGAGDVWMRAHGGIQRINVKAPGGIRMLSDEAETAGVSLAAGGGAWTTISDRNAKENFKPVDTGAVLEKVVALPLSTWNYKSQDNAIQHLGPMAQDFKAAFGLGESDTGITTVDADGVALAAIQGLNQKLERENAELKARLEKLERMLNDRHGGAK